MQAIQGHDYKRALALLVSRHSNSFSLHALNAEMNHTVIRLAYVFCLLSATGQTDNKNYALTPPPEENSNLNNWFHDKKNSHKYIIKINFVYNIVLVHDLQMSVVMMMFPHGQYTFRNCDVKGHMICNEFKIFVFGRMFFI